MFNLSLAYVKEMTQDTLTKVIVDTRPCPYLPSDLIKSPLSGTLNNQRDSYDGKIPVSKTVYTKIPHPGSF